MSYCFNRFLSEKSEVFQLPLVEALIGHRTEGGASEKEEEEEEEESSMIYSEVHHLMADRPGRVHCVALWYNVYMSPESCHGQLNGECGKGSVFSTGPRFSSKIDSTPCEYTQSCVDGLGSDSSHDSDYTVPLDRADRLRELSPGEVEEGGAESHFRQVAFLLETPRSLQRGDKLAVRVVVDKVIGVWCEIL